MALYRGSRSDGGLSAFAFDQPGLFARKSSTNILSDPRILKHLSIVAEEAQKEEDEDEEILEEDEYEFNKRELTDRITEYNRRNQLGAFRIVQKVSHVRYCFCLYLLVN